MVRWSDGQGGDGPSLALGFRIEGAERAHIATTVSFIDETWTLAGLNNSSLAPLPQPPQLAGDGQTDTTQRRSRNVEAWNRRNVET